MSLAGFAIGGLVLLGLGAFVVVEGPILFEKLKQYLSDQLSSAGKAVLAAPGQELDYLQTSHAQEAPLQVGGIDPITGQQAYTSGYLADLSAQQTQDSEAQVAAARAKEPASATIARLKADQSALQGGQPYIVDLGTGEKLTLDDVNSRLAALGAS